MIKVTPTTGIEGLQNIFAKVAHVFYNDAAIDVAPGDTIAATMELPVIEDSVNFDTGSIDKTEIKLTTGTIWTSRATKGDSDINFQVASVSAQIASLFLNTKGTTGYNLEVKKATGALIFTDEEGEGLIVLPNVEMYGSFVAGEGENPAYFNVSVTPRINAEGAALYIGAAAK